METFLNYLKGDYATDFIHFLICIISFKVAIKLRARHKNLAVFRIYFGVFIVLKLIVYYCYHVNETISSSKFGHAADYIFTIFEYGCFAYFFKKTFVSAANKTLVNVVSSLFLLCSCWLMFYDSNFDINFGVDSTNKLFSVQSIGLLVLCISYYVELFKSLPQKNIKNLPECWVITGLTFFMLSTLPYSLLLNYIYYQHPSVTSQLFSIFYIFYILFFLMIIRAYLCKPETTSYSTSDTQLNSKPQSNTLEPILI